VFSKAHWTLAADFSGNEKVLDRCERDLRQMAEKCGCESFVVLAPDQMPPAASRKREFIPIALASSPAATIVKMSVLPTRMNEVLASAARAAETNSLPWAAIARGVGVIYFALLPKDRSDESHRRVIQATDQILFECAALGGNATIPWSPAEWKSSLKVWGLERGDIDQMRKLKKLFDPLWNSQPGPLRGRLVGDGSAPDGTRFARRRARRCCGGPERVFRPRQARIFRLFALRTLRAMPQPLPHVPPVGTGSGFAARAYPADRVGGPGKAGAGRFVRRAHRPLPRLPRLRNGVPLGRRVRPLVETARAQIEQHYKRPFASRLARDFVTGSSFRILRGSQRRRDS
jgi:hypothetical protein